MTNGTGGAGAAGGPGGPNPSYMSRIFTYLRNSPKGIAIALLILSNVLTWKYKNGEISRLEKTYTTKISQLERTIEDLKNRTTIAEHKADNYEKIISFDKLGQWKSDLEKLNNDYKTHGVKLDNNTKAAKELDKKLSEFKKSFDKKMNNYDETLKLKTIFDGIGKIIQSEDISEFHIRDY